MKRQRRKKSDINRRTLRKELLEPRLLLANDFAFQNPGQFYDVNRDLRVTPIDALQVINFIARNGVEYDLPTLNSTDGFPDVNGTGNVTPIDALEILNTLALENPILSARLVNDSAPNELSNLDFVTKDYGLEFGITAGTGSERLELRINGDDQSDFSLLTDVFENGLLQLDEDRINSVAGATIAEGQHQFEARIAGTSKILTFSITVDRTAPTVPAFDLDPGFDSAPLGDQVTTFDPVTLIGTTSPGSLVVLQDTGQSTTADVESGIFTFTEVALNDGENQFTALAASVSGNVSSFTQTIVRGTPSGVGITEFSPSNGEQMVNVNRETIVRFDERIDPTTVTDEAFYLIANGERIPGRITVSSTEFFATFVYDSPLPASTEVRIVFDGDLVLGRDGLAVDADGDGTPGGTATADFRTIALTSIAGTSISSRVLDAHRSIDVEPFPIPVPQGDPQFDPMATGTVSIPFTRATFIGSTGTDTDNPRRHPNLITSFLDAGMVYGSDPERATQLRELDGSGRLKTSNGDLLPINDATHFPDGPMNVENQGPFSDSALFVAGDIRASENPILAALHTLLIREHNRFATETKNAFPTLSGEEIYQQAKRWIGALIQHITYQEFLPALLGGSKLAEYEGYAPDVNPGVSAAFSGAAFRFGHSMQTAEILRLGSDGADLEGGPLPLQQSFFNPSPLISDGIEPYLQGAIAQQANQVDTQEIDALRNFLFGPPGAGGMDLAAINVQRGRDLGLPDYNTGRTDFGLPPVSGFDEITSNAAVADALEATYGSVDNIDLWVGGLAEDHLEGAAIGELFAEIIKDQFTRARDGDRFWYENGQFSQDDLDAIRATTISDLITRNSSIEDLPENVFAQSGTLTGPAAAGTAAASPLTPIRRIDGVGTNEEQKGWGRAGAPLLQNFTPGYTDDIASPGGDDRPGPRAVSNSLFSQLAEQTNPSQLTSLFVSWGQLIDHDLSKTPSQSSVPSVVPVAGATLSVIGRPELTVQTDSTGFFILDDLPSPEAFVLIDGSTATNAPEGGRYTYVAKPFETIPGQAINLAKDGTEFNIYLPVVPDDAAQTLSTTETTTVKLQPQSLAIAQEALPDIDPAMLELLSIDLAPGSAVDRDGNPVPEAFIVPVPPDRLPEPLPPGLTPELIWSVQSVGAESFDVPAPISYPNLYGLEPGEKRQIFSFDHDAGEWVTIGTGTVSEDGKTIDSDPGVGLRAPGWGFVPPQPSTRNDNIPNPNWPPPDRDGDGEPDVTDDDDNNNGVPDDQEQDRDGDGIPDAQDDDDDGDGTPDENDNDYDNDGIPDDQDPDDDNDGVPDEEDDDFEYRITVGITGQTSFSPLSVSAFAGINLPGSIFTDGESVTVGFEPDPWEPFGGKSNHPFSFDYSFTVSDFQADLIPSLSIGLPTLNASVELSAAFGIGGIVDITGGEPEVELDDIELRPGNVQLDFSVSIEHPVLCRIPFDIGETICSAKEVSVPLLGAPSTPLPSVDIPLPIIPISDYNGDFFAGLMAAAATEGSISARVFLQKDRVPKRPSGNPISASLASAITTENSTLQQSNLSWNAPKYSSHSTISDDPNVHYLFEMENGLVLRGQVAPEEPIDAILPSNTPFTLSLFYPRTNRSAIFSGETGPPGSTCPDPIPMTQIGGYDFDGDGLSDIAEHVIGTSLFQADTDQDGINDFSEISQGLNPLDDRGFPTGIISSLPLNGEAREVVVAGSALNATSQTAYVATGSHGLAIVDASQFNNPIVLGQLDLPGSTTEIAVEPELNLAVLAGSNGLHLVDVSDPMMPELLQTVTLAGGATSVEVFDGLAYASTLFGTVVSIDLVNGERLQTLALGAGGIHSLAREQDKLFATSSDRRLHVIDLAGFEMAARGNVEVPAQAKQLFVGNSIAYISDGINGYSTVDVSNPDLPQLISGPDTPAVQAANRKTVANGSGLVVIAAGSRGLELHNGSDPEETYRFLTQIDTPGDAQSVALASGIAFVADGSAGLQVINYVSFDNRGIAPEISISVSAEDADPQVDGVQVIEGDSLPIFASITDDVQVRNVELLVNGQVVENDVSFPFDTTAIVPNIATSGTELSLQVRATDTGGNETVSDPVELMVVPDTFAPTVVGTTPNADQKVFFTPSIDVRFSEPIDENLVELAGFTLIHLGDDQVLGGEDDTVVPIGSVDVRSLGRKITLFPESILETGMHQLSVDATFISDRAGNPLDDDFAFSFEIRPASDIRADQGTARIGRAPSANVQQEIAFEIPGATDNSQIAFPTINSSGSISSRTVSPVRIEGNRVFYIVPDDATTGNLALPNQPGDPFLFQIVPTLSDIDQGENDRFHGGSLSVFGTGFSEGALTVHFGSEPLIDSGLSSGPDVTASYPPPTFSHYVENSVVYLTVPDGVPSGPISITTLGGTSDPFPITFDAITGVADSGTPADTNIASANVAQAITLDGSGFDSTTDVVFPTVNINGVVSQIVVHPIAVNEDGTQLTVIVPTEAVTGEVLIVGDQNNSQAMLQIVPVISEVGMTSINSSGINFNAVIAGSGFIEGNQTTYSFGSLDVIDDNNSSSPIDVTSNVYPNGANRGRGTNLNSISFSDDIFGAIRVTTAGGTSAPHTTQYSDLVALAASGTPADPAQASANPGQTVQLIGSGLSEDTDLVARYVDISGSVRFERLSPNSVNAQGTNATVLLKDYYNGAFDLKVFGSDAAHLLQIVPVIGQTDISGLNSAVISGTGFVEGASTYTFDGQEIIDDNHSSSPIDVTSSVYPEGVNRGTGANLSLPLPNAGIGQLTVTTAGGTSQAVQTNFVSPALGRLYDLAIDTLSGDLIVATNTQWFRIDPDTGETLASFALPDGSTSNLGLQFLANETTLAGVTVPAGSLLITDGSASFDKIFAVDPANGNTLVTLDLQQNLDPVAGLIDSATGSLFLLDDSPDQIYQVDPANGNVLNTFNAPFPINYGGLALDPVTGNLWVASNQSNTIAEIQTDGTEVRTVDLQIQSIRTEITGLAFDAGGDLWATSTHGVVYKINLMPPVATPPSLLSITGTALDGTPTDTDVASANVRQVIELTGANLHRGSSVVFPTRNTEGVPGTTTVTPTAVSGDGTRIQVVVPDLATTGEVSIVGGSGNANLQIVPLATGLSGRPGSYSPFTLWGSGFMEGQTTITVGGVVYDDVYNNLNQGDISGSRNGRLDLVLPFAVEDTISINTPGGSFQLPLPEFTRPAFIQWNGIQASAFDGVPTDESIASANTGQSITLVGRGFTDSTRVQFTATDNQGSVETLTRTGFASPDGERLTINVPALAITGSIRVVGSDTELPLQVVPTLRSVGGQLTPGQTILLEGTGLEEDNLNITIDGQSVTSTLEVITVNDSNSDYYLNQQAVRVTVPDGIDAGVISISTPGGSSTLLPDAAINTLADLVSGSDIGDTLATALSVTLPENNRVSMSPTIGDNDFAGRDVDLFSMDLNAGDEISLEVVRLTTSSLYLRLFDDNGLELTADAFSGPDSNPIISALTVPATGRYYAGISGWANTNYDPEVPDSGNNASTGNYRLIAQRVGGLSTSLTGITATSESGTPSQSTIASANTEQTITINGGNLLADDLVVFTTMDQSGNLHTTAVSPASVSPDATSLEVVVPRSAVSGMVRLERENAGQFLQIVPTLSDVDQGENDRFHDGSLSVFGTGFSEGALTVHFGSEPLIDSGLSSGPDVTASYPPPTFSHYVENSVVYLTVPDGVPSGPISITTLGGTSDPFPITFDAITGVADSGTPADTNIASANVAQAITLDGSGFDSTTDVVFPTVNINGVVSQIVVHPIAVNEDGTQLTVIVPTEAVTGEVLIVGDQNNSQAMLQIVPVISEVGMTSINSSGINFSAVIAGSGFIEGNQTTYSFGSLDVIDDNNSSSPIDVTSNVYPNGANRGRGTNLNSISFSDDIFGAIRVTTAGGTSAPHTTQYSDLVALAASGTPADPAQASANPGQTVQLIGSGLSEDTDLVARYVDISGSVRFERLSPNSVNAQGTNATVLLKDYYNGAFDLKVFGSDAAHLLQIVPVIGQTDISGLNSAVISGTGFVEGASTYTFDGQEIIDDNHSSSPIDVTSSVYPEGVNRGTGANLSLPLPNAGIGQLTVTTAGGTSQAVQTNFVSPALGRLYDLAIDTLSGDLIVATNTQWFRIDPDTGETLASFALPDGSTSNLGLQFLANETTLAGVTVPAGSLLITDGSASFDKIFAVDPANGNTLVTLDLQQNLDPVAGLIDSATGSLFLLDDSPDQIYQVDPANGNVLNTFNAPFPINYGGLALDPVTGNLWVASNQSNTIAEIQTDGTEVRTVDLQIQSIRTEISGLAFDAGGDLWATSTHGVVYKINLMPPVATPPSLLSITGTALDGTPTDTDVASANVRQVIELTGANLHRGSSVVFPTRNTEGVPGTTTVTPTAVSGDGTRIQVVVPDLATTGEVSIVGGSGNANLQIVPLATGLSGRPGSYSPFTLWGSGFMEGQTTITVGGVVYDDVYNNLNQGDISGSRNGRLDLVLPFAVEDTISINTPGGSFQLPLPEFTRPAFIQWNGIQASAFDGVPTDESIASANTGQSITLVGRGFTDSTRVQFTATDNQGSVETLTRTGFASPDGERLTINVPALAITGSIRVVGSDTELPLQVVPTLRSVGGQLTPGQTILLEGTGLEEDNLNITIDGQSVTSTLEVITVNDSNSDYYLNQQAVRVTVPDGIDAGVISISTPGGSSTLLPVAAINTLADLVSGSDIGDTLATALSVNLPENNRVAISPTIGDNDFAGRDVDLFSMDLNAGDEISLEVVRLTTSSLYLRLFDDNGLELTADAFSGPDSNPIISALTVPATGRYYAGISGWANTNYDPEVPDSGNNASTGNYRLIAQRVGGLSTSLTGITATSESGTPSQSTVASANTEQTITINGGNLLADDLVVFTTMDQSGNLHTTAVSPASVSPDATSLEVVVPRSAVSGMVRLERENAGQFLQIVPTLSDVDQGENDRFHDGSLSVFGTGFSEGALTVHFGSEPLIDSGLSSGPDVTASYPPPTFSHYVENSVVYLTVPDGVPSGPISITTLGGTSDPFPITFDAITGVADSGTPADTNIASANVAQAITLDGSGFDSTTDVVFPTVNINGVVSQIVVHPIAVNEDGTQLTVIVPTEAVTGEVLIVGDQNNSQAMLQIVPVISEVGMTSINSSGINFSAVIAGSGFIEGNQTTYSFGSLDVIDDNNSSSPIDVTSNVYPNGANRGRGTNLNSISFSDDIFGAIRVTTAGGTSAPHTTQYSDLVALAASGTPADPAQASANPGQTVQLIGSGLSEDTDLVARYVDISGSVRFERLSPNSVNAQGTNATVLLKDYYNGAFDLKVFGSDAAHLLQIVPVIGQTDISGLNSAVISGTGFVEGASTYTFDGQELIDDNHSSSPIDVTSSVYPEGVNRGTGANLSLPLPNAGIGQLTVTTAGGTSQAVQTNFVSPALGRLYDLAIDTLSGDLIVATNTQWFRIDPDTGETLASFALPDGSTSNLGLQFLANETTLAGVTVPAGSLLITDGSASFDKIFAVDPANGNTLVTLDLQQNLDPVAGLIDSATGSLFLLDDSPDQIYQVDPANGNVLNTFNAPFPINYGGLALDPVTGNLWVASNQSNTIAEIQTDGTEVRTIDLQIQSIRTEISGLAFDAGGELWATSTHGVVYKINLMPSESNSSRSQILDTVASEIEQLALSPLNDANMPGSDSGELTGEQVDLLFSTLF